MIAMGLFTTGMWLAEWLPAAPLYGLARLVGWLLSEIPSTARRRLRRNLARVFGTSPDAAGLRPYVRRVYQTQAANYVDLLRARRIAPEDVARRIVRDGGGWPAIQRAAAEKRGLVLVTAHFGRFEFLSHYLGHLGVPLTLLVERLQPPALFELVCRQRARPTLHVIAHDLALRPCLRALSRGEAVLVFADWDASGDGVPVSFFGQQVRLPRGPAIMALRAGAPLFVGLGLPADQAGQSVHAAQSEQLRMAIEPPVPLERTADFDADVQRVTQAIARVFEQAISRYPEQWVMFHEIWLADEPGTSGTRVNQRPAPERVPPRRDRRNGQAQVTRAGQPSVLAMPKATR